MENYWTDKRPEIACVFVTRNLYEKEYEYNLWRFEWQSNYLGWLTIDGEEWADISECVFDEYLILEKQKGELNDKRKKVLLRNTTGQYFQ